jgi:predicted nucleic acid-binding protein
VAAYYCDSSALTKRYVAEPVSAWVTALTDRRTGHDLYTVTLTAPELIAALTRRARGGHLDPLLAGRAVAAVRADWRSQYQPIAADSRIVERAMDIAETHGLRGYDAVHVATALELHEYRRARGLPSLTFVSADQEQLRVAAGEGLAVDDPNRHP